MVLVLIVQLASEVVTLVLVAQAPVLALVVLALELELELASALALALSVGPTSSVLFIALSLLLSKSSNVARCSRQR